MGLKQAEQEYRDAKMQARQEVYPSVAVDKCGIISDRLTGIQKEVADELQGMLDEIEALFVSDAADNNDRKLKGEIGRLANQITVFGKIKLSEGCFLGGFVKELREFADSITLEPKHRNPNPEKGKKSKQKEFMNLKPVNAIAELEKKEALRRELDQFNDRFGNPSKTPVRTPVVNFPGSQPTMSREEYLEQVKREVRGRGLPRVQVVKKDREGNYYGHDEESSSRGRSWLDW